MRALVNPGPAKRALEEHPKPEITAPTDAPAVTALKPGKSATLTVQSPQHGPWRRLRGVVVALLIAAALAAALRFTVLRPPLVSVAEVTRDDVTAEIEGTGTVTADVLASISSKITGRVEQVFVVEGDTVQAGQVIATLDQTDLLRQIEAAGARLAGAKETMQENKRETDRRNSLVAKGWLSREEGQQYQARHAVAMSAIDAAQAELGSASYNLTLAQIPALSGGIVTKRWAVPGVSVVAGQPMFIVADTSLIYVRTYIDQNLTGKISKGRAASVILRGREDQPLVGHVHRIDPQADAGTEEMVAEVAFTIPNDKFLLGQWANVYIQAGEAKDALVVPRTALMPMENKTFVFVVDPNDKIRQEPVTVLASSPRTPIVAVAGHLTPGERVVLMPMGLKAGETVRPASAQQDQAPMRMP
jgi:RND family efflux transporter MFP subunit